MTDAPPAIIVTAPGRSSAEAVREIALAKEGGADAVEIRVDRWSEPERTRLSALFPSALPLVATYRSHAEGGEGSDEPDLRRPVLAALAALPFRWVDLELERDLPFLGDLPEAERLGRIVSCHLAGPDASRWGEALGRLEGIDGVGKLVAGLSVGDVLRTVVPRLEGQGGKVVVHTTGPSGPLLRGWARRLGFPFVFAALPSGAGPAPVEPSQIPVDRLRPFLHAAEPAPLFAVCGRPVEHSRSPEIHHRWMREDGVTGLYLALEFADEREFLESLPGLAEGGFRGLNVTQPFKTAAAEAADELGAGARACGAANCLTLSADGLVGENTDLLAILRRLDELRAAGRWDGRSLTVVGSGGAARATLAAAREIGARASVVARRTEAARHLAAEFGASAPGPDERRPNLLLVHATPVGRTSGSRPEVPLGPLLAEGGVLLDWVYRPESPVVRDAARTVGATYEDGWRLLVYQAAASFEIWWGHRPPGDAVERTVTEGPCAA